MFFWCFFHYAAQMTAKIPEKPEKEAFGLWKDRGVDALEYERRLREGWVDFVIEAP